MRRRTPPISSFHLCAADFPGRLAAADPEFLRPRAAADQIMPTQGSDHLDRSFTPLSANKPR